MARVRTGLDRVLARPEILGRARLGLVAHAASVASDLTHAVWALRRRQGLRLVALFGPEHGLRGDAQDLVAVGSHRDELTGLPVHSLYGRHLEPSAAMLRGLDVLVVDLQDVGARYYTFVYTLLHCMVAAARHGVKVVVLDRPNPLGGASVQGNVLDPDWRSFVGRHPLAARHGMTVGELATMFREELRLEVELQVVRMSGWRRAMTFEQTGLPWVLPSPNMPSTQTAWVYPGGCLVEGTNLSEGRGTTRPFELVGAPWIDPWKLADALQRRKLPGARFRPTYFTPTFQKHRARRCGGVQVHVADRRRFDAFATYLALIAEARRQVPGRFAWRSPPYEYETRKLPIDILCGTDRVRRAIELGVPISRLQAGFRREAAAFRRRRARFLLYD